MDDITGFVPNPNLERDLHTFPAVQASVQQTAEAIAAKARELAPIESGAYAAGIQVNRAQSKSGVWRVFASDQKSSWIEFGNGRGQDAHFTMRKAVEALGLKFKKGN